MRNADELKSRLTQPPPRPLCPQVTGSPNPNALFLFMTLKSRLVAVLPRRGPNPRATFHPILIGAPGLPTFTLA